MRKNKAIQLAFGVLATAVFVSIPSTKAHADSLFTAEQGVAGISLMLENTTDQQLADAYNASIKSLSTEDAEEEVVSPYANLGVSKADSYVNIRKEPSTESEIVGKLYRGCAADILERLDGDWVKIKSGDVEGYIASDFLAIGKDAEAMVDEYATKYATVKTETLRVREERSTDSKILTLIPIGETYVITKEYKDWVEILLGNDDNDDTHKEFTGFVNKDYIDISVEFKYAISIEEENRIKKAEEESERAEQERKEKLAQEEAERKEAERKADEEASSKDDDNEDNDTSSDSSSYTGSSTGNEIVDYALKFVGNPYVWAGTSLTHGADCSGFVQAVYRDFGITIPRTSREQAAGAGRKVSESELQPGDLIFYANSGGTVNHVAMYIGGGRIVHAANSRQGIITSNYKYRDVYCVRRIVN